MFCNNCGREIPDNSKFCRYCGAPSCDGTQHNNSQYSNSQYGNSQYDPQNNSQYNPGPGYYPAPITKRSIPLCIVLSLITLGIYGIYWLYCLAEDINTVSNHPDDTSGGMVILLSLVTCGIYGFYWIYKAGEKLDEAKSFNGMFLGGNSSILYLILSILGFGIVAYALMQNELNKFAGN